MRNYSLIFFISLILIFITTVCSSQKNTAKDPEYNFVPEDPELYNTIVAMDSTFFQAYNTCDLNKQAAIYSENIEFYHDTGGLMTVKQEILDNTKKYVCGKVIRELVKESIEVYPIKGFGAIEIGLHKFHNNTEKEGSPSHSSKFIIFWKKDNDNWIITKVVSLH
jgi:ketosteroid isomerase-like protein